MNSAPKPSPMIATRMFWSLAMSVRPPAKPRAVPSWIINAKAVGVGGWGGVFDAPVFARARRGVEDSAPATRGADTHNLRVSVHDEDRPPLDPCRAGCRIVGR